MDSEVDLDCYFGARLGSIDDIKLFYMDLIIEGWFSGG